MINLRYHIVSIVAVFLALAVGIFTGSTLLDRTILDGLEARQNSLDRRNDELKALADSYEEALNADDAGQAQVVSAGTAALDETMLVGETVLIIATRGIDEQSVSQLGALLDRLGGSTMGVLWADESIDLTDVDVARRASAAWWGPEGVPALLGPVEALTGGVANELAKVAGGTLTVDPAAVTTTAPVDPAADPTADPTAIEGTSADSSSGTDRFRRLIDEGFIEWEPLSDSGTSEFTLPIGGLVTVVLSGEDAAMGAIRFVYPVVDAMAGNGVPVVVGEVHRPRFSTERIKDDSVLPRGFVVDRFRERPESLDTVITVDNVDQAFGRLAVALSLRNGRLPRGGAYGSGELADEMFPPDI